MQTSHSLLFKYIYDHPLLPSTHAYRLPSIAHHPSSIQARNQPSYLPVSSQKPYVSSALTTTLTAQPHSRPPNHLPALAPYPSIPLPTSRLPPQHTSVPTESAFVVSAAIAVPPSSPSADADFKSPSPLRLPHRILPRSCSWARSTHRSCNGVIRCEEERDISKSWSYVVSDYPAEREAIVLSNTESCLLVIGDRRGTRPRPAQTGAGAQTSARA